MSFDQDLDSPGWTQWMDSMGVDDGAAAAANSVDTHGEASARPDEIPAQPDAAGASPARVPVNYELVDAASLVLVWCTGLSAVWQIFSC